MGGYLMKTMGGSGTFRTFGLIALACAGVHFLVQKLLDRFVGERGKINKYFSDTKAKNGDGKKSIILEDTTKNDNNINLLSSNGKGFVDVSLDDLSKI